MRRWHGTDTWQMRALASSSMVPRDLPSGSHSQVRAQMQDQRVTTPWARGCGRADSVREGGAQRRLLTLWGGVGQGRAGRELGANLR